MKYLIPPSEGKSKIKGLDIKFKDTNFVFSKEVNQVVRLLDLIDDEDLTYYDAIGMDIIDNYSGNNTFYWTQEELSFERNLSAQISNDNGTVFPIHIQNEMTGDRETYNHSSWSPRHWLTLSVGDKIKIYGSGSEADGLAREGWSLKIKYDPTGETLSEIKIS